MLLWMLLVAAELTGTHCFDANGWLFVMPYIDVKLHEVNKLSDTDRGAGGFGSTGLGK